VTPEEVLQFVIEKLEKHNIEHMVTGSFASNFYGVPRTTYDADIVISTDYERLKKFADEIKNEFYIDLDMIQEALSHNSIFNIIHYETGFKIDFIIRKEGQYYQNEFERRKAYKIGNKSIYFTSPEDTIISKLIWSKESNSEKQFRDAVGVAKIQKETLDFEYLKFWADKMDVKDLLNKLLNELEE
jgi:hypothetical protein